MKVLNQFMEGIKKKSEKSMEHPGSEENSHPKVSKLQSTEEKKSTPRSKASSSENVDDLIELTGLQPNLSGAKVKKMASPEIAKTDSADENVVLKDSVEGSENPEDPGLQSPRKEFSQLINQKLKEMKFLPLITKPQQKTDREHEWMAILKENKIADLRSGKLICEMVALQEPTST